MYNIPPIANRDDPMRKLKSSLTLDLPKRETPLTFDGVLSSPDVRMLKLATPELDRLLLQHQAVSGGGGSAPGQHHIWPPKTITEEQEAYARGFVDALLELRGKREEEEEEETASELCLSPKSSATEVDVFSYGKSLDLSRTRYTSSEAFPYSYERDSVGNIIQLPPEVVSPSASVFFSDSVARAQRHVDSSLSFSQGQRSSDERLHWVTEGVHLKSRENLTAGVRHRHQRVHYPSKTPTAEGPQSMLSSGVPLISCLSNTPPISPIDMVQQEAIKLARKRARNRLAATRCRNRKLERIARLQERVDDLRQQNVQLMSTASELRDIVGRVRHEIHTHTVSGCCMGATAQQIKFA